MKQWRPLTIALCIPPAVAEKTLARSRALREKGGKYSLDTRHLPHVTLYRGLFPQKNMPKIRERLREAVEAQRPFTLTSIRYRGSDLGYIGISYSKSRSAQALQMRVIRALNPLREHKEDAKEKKNVAQTSSVQKKDFARYGYDFVGQNFIPHLTLSRLAKADPSALNVLKPANFSFKAFAVGLFAPGSEHTCCRLIEAYTFSR